MTKLSPDTYQGTCQCGIIKTYDRRSKDGYCLVLREKAAGKKALHPINSEKSYGETCWAGFPIDDDAKYVVRGASRRNSDPSEAMQVNRDEAVRRARANDHARPPSDGEFRAQIETWKKKKEAERGRKAERKRKGKDKATENDTNDEEEEDEREDEEEEAEAGPIEQDGVKVEAKL